MTRLLLPTLLLTSLCASPALAQRATPSPHSELRVPDIFRPAGAHEGPRVSSEMRTPPGWQAPAPSAAPSAAQTPRRRELSADLVIPDIFRRPGDPQSGRRTDLRTPGEWSAPSPRGAPPEPAALVEAPLASLVEAAERDGSARVGAYVFTGEELRAALAYLGEGTGVAAFVAGAGPELLARARERGRATLPAARLGDVGPANLGRALDRP